MKNYKIRFNLSRGENYMKWKVITPDGIIKYYNPELVTLEMNNCLLKNAKKTAMKIYEGGEKVVCAWVLSENLIIRKKELKNRNKENDRLYYNPRISPNWVYNDLNVDNARFNKIISYNKHLYIN